MIEFGLLAELDECIGNIYVYNIRNKASAKNKRTVFKLYLNLLNGVSTIIDERNYFLRYLKIYLLVEYFGRKAHERFIKYGFGRKHYFDENQLRSRDR